MVLIHANDDEPTFTSNVPSPLPAGGSRWSTPATRRLPEASQLYVVIILGLQSNSKSPSA